jgi:hypothetical protein
VGIQVGISVSRRERRLGNLAASSTLVSAPQLSQLCVICSTDGVNINGINDLMVVGSPHSGQ